MIWLRRMHVINWMYYDLKTIEWDRSNLLTGVTGSGKSSLLDGLQVVILGETGRFFNRSATGAKSDRTLVTYLRGKYQENEYKRPDKAFSSYLAIDFYDDFHRESFCYGVVFDISEDNTVEKDYFFLAEAFQTDWALKPLSKAYAARSREEFKKRLKKLGRSAKFFAPGEYKKDLLVRLGIYDEHFFRVFRTAVAYVPLDKIEDFIVQNICQIEDGIDIPKMRTAIHEYQQMQRDMADFQERQRELEELNRIYDDYSARLDTYETQEYIVRRAGVDRLHEEQEAAEAEMRRLEDERERCAAEEEELNRKKSEKGERQLELVGLINSDPATTQRQKLDDERAVCSKKIEERESLRDKQLLRLNQLSLAWVRRIKETTESDAGQKLESSEMPELIRTFGAYTRYTKENFAQIDVYAIAEANSRLERLRNEFLSVQTGWKTERNDVKREIAEYQERLTELKKGIKSYPKDLLALKDHLTRELTAQMGRPAEVAIFADLVSITQSEWINVVEAYLRRQKFYLLVDPSCYRQAVRIFKRYSRENKIYRYRIVNTESLLTSQVEVRESSLAKVIITDHPAARKYTDYLLGRVERVEDISSVSGKRAAVTVDGMLYQAFTVARFNEADWRMRYIGQESIAQQIEETERLLRESNAQVEMLDQLIAPLQAWADEKTLSDEFLENLEQAVEGAKELPALDKELDEIWLRIQTLDMSFVDKMKAELKQIQSDINELERKIKEIDKKLGALDKEHEAQFQISDHREQTWETEQKKFLISYPEGNRIAERSSARYENERIQKGSAEKVQADFEPALSQTKIRLDALTNQFREKAEAFNRRHTDAVINTALSSSEWRDAYNEIRGVRLEDYTSQVSATKERAEEIFYNEFINHLKGNFDTVKREINLLNKALEEYTFGKTKYRFKCSPTDNAEMRKYYEMINNKRLDGASIFDLLEPDIDMAEYEPLVKTLFQLISSEGNDPASRQQVEANIEKYKSLKSYLRFDLVEVDPSGKEYPLSRTMGSKSGGERQTPFYVAILASLMKTYKMSQDANSLRLVVFDEAFDKIDTGRIEECINMLRQIGFQSIIAAPDHKASYIAPLVERTWVVLKPDDKTSILQPYHKDLEYEK